MPGCWVLGGVDGAVRALGQQRREMLWVALVDGAPFARRQGPWRLVVLRVQAAWLELSLVIAVRAEGWRRSSRGDGFPALWR